jgi:hypothetical protein
MDYCNKEIDTLIAQQSAEPNQEKRKQIVWDRSQAYPGRSSPDDLLHARRHLLAARSEEHDHYDQ